MMKCCWSSSTSSSSIIIDVAKHRSMMMKLMMIINWLMIDWSWSTSKLIMIDNMIDHDRSVIDHDATCWHHDRIMINMLVTCFNKMWSDPEIVKNVKNAFFVCLRFFTFLSISGVRPRFGGSKPVPRPPPGGVQNRGPGNDHLPKNPKKSGNRAPFDYHPNTKKSLW